MKAGIAIVSLAAALFALPVMAQPGPGGGAGMGPGGAGQGAGQGAGPGGGKRQPMDCKLFGTVCTPDNPMGACMVSSEGACAAHYAYGRHRASTASTSNTPSHTSTPTESHPT